MCEMEHKTMKPGRCWFRSRLGSLTVGLGMVAIAIATPVFTTAALAETELDLGGESAFTDQELSAGSISVVVNYTPFDVEAPDAWEQDNLTYQLFYNGEPLLTDSQQAFNYGRIWLEDLDSNGTAEVLVSTYSGGAHCCTNYKIYTWQDGEFVTAETGYLDGGGGSFEDLNGDGLTEFVTVDNSFLYRFSSYAGSFPPSLIYTFKNGQLEETTREHEDELRSHAQQMYQAAQENTEFPNGVLAGYVAQKILLGEYQEGWDFMLAHYDSEDDWGLTINIGDEEVGRYYSFPFALKAFLIEQGYLNDLGEPISK